jgi:hypothetical protein
VRTPKHRHHNMDPLPILKSLASLLTVNLAQLIRRAVKIDNQAQFQRRKYLFSLGDMNPIGGSYDFEETSVFNIEDEGPCIVKTNRGTVRAKVCCNYPTLP